MLSENQTAYGKECSVAWTVSPVILRPAAWEIVCTWCVWRISPEHWLSHKPVQSPMQRVSHPQPKCPALNLTSVKEPVALIFPSILPFFVALMDVLWTQSVWYDLQHQDREGEERACTTARDDQDGNQRGGNRRGDGEGEEILPAADVWSQSDGVICIVSFFSCDFGGFFRFFFLCPGWKTLFKWKTNLFNVFTVSP